MGLKKKSYELDFHFQFKTRPGSGIKMRDQNSMFLKTAVILKTKR